MANQQISVLIYQQPKQCVLSHSSKGCKHTP